ncbi:MULTISPECIES: YceK/YidQ family lipoprotein [Pseudomonas]|uniref:YceK/YidQ family lipoprotein n=1 Tax=Pseudomonas TaxID=286 RepID=UPI000B3581F1|nr:MULTISPECIES: YceK/YidQ family lipoprotein [Pseudomonas]PMY71033.1 YceK/YidQ family lipoprotein [Pseudomonas sp. FW305-25]PMY75562.1 YceK/YidQ family lipoprotein [Pseudomonas sp. FW126-L8]PNA81416.1 YceK/YidQ family lipoprotein [Pseudomonas sp. FW305-76]
MSLKCALVIITAVSASGCGTINTTFRDDAVSSNKLARWHSHCDSVPRTYSGVVLDYCALNAPPRQTTGFDGHPSAALIALDMGISGIADTLLLPYTVYLQNTLGDIKRANF